MKLNIQANTTEINNLITLAQTAPSAEAYERAIQALWTIFGEFFTALVAKKSFLFDSDFSLWGCSPAKVPFAAYIAKIGEWRMLDEKRKNAKRSKREVLDRCASNNDSEEEQYSRIDNCDINPFTGERNEQDCEFDKRDFVARIKKCLAANDPKALSRLDVMYAICNEGDYSDAEAARRIGCERANMKNVKNNLQQIMAKFGFEEEYRRLMAA